jgi:hypothetical protein
MLLIVDCENDKPYMIGYELNEMDPNMLSQRVGLLFMAAALQGHFMCDRAFLIQKRSLGEEADEDLKRRGYTMIDGEVKSLNPLEDQQFVMIIDNIDASMYFLSRSQVLSRDVYIADLMRELELDKVIRETGVV